MDQPSDNKIYFEPLTHELFSQSIQVCWEVLQIQNLISETTYDDPSPEAVSIGQDMANRLLKFFESLAFEDQYEFFTEDEFVEDDGSQKMSTDEKINGKNSLFFSKSVSEISFFYHFCFF